MKKVFYLLAITIFCNLALVSCTEDEVKPQTEVGGNGGGSPSDPKGS